MKRAAALLGVLLALLSVAAPAQATWSGRDGAITFVRGPHIWVQLPSEKQPTNAAEHLYGAIGDEGLVTSASSPGCSC